MSDGIFSYFENNLIIISNALESIDKESYEALLSDMVETARSHNKIVFCGMGKNIYICKKIVSTMHSLGIRSCFLHPTEAKHGELGQLEEGDLLIVLSKSGKTKEVTEMLSYITRNKIKQWAITFSEDALVKKQINGIIVIHMQDEGDLWNMVPNNSSVISLIVLQTLTIATAKHLGLRKESDFLPNHPGGIIGGELS